MQQARWQRWPGPKRLGVIMIVKNEAERLPDLFADIAQVADEVVVVDTGSTDGTLDVCRNWGVTLIQRPWRDDFSYARNQAIEQASAAYLLWLDGDDRVPQETARCLIELRDNGLVAAADVAFRMTVHNVDAAGKTLDSFVQVRIFPNRARVRYRGAIHESFMDSLRAEGVGVQHLAAELLHAGYATPEARWAKAQRNIRLLRAEVARDPSDIHARVHLAQALAGLEEHSRAAECMDQVIHLSERAQGHTAIQAELRVVRGRYRSAAGDLRGAAEDYRAACRLRPSWTVARVLLAELHAREGSWGEVANLLMGDGYQRDFSPGAFGVPVARLEGMYWWLVGRCHLAGGRPQSALLSLQHALDRDPARVDIRLDLAQAWLELRGYHEARLLLEPLGSDEAALPRLFELLAALGLARAGVGELDGAGECLAPLVDFLGDMLPDPAEASPAQLCAALGSIGQDAAAQNLAALDALVVAGTA